MSGELDFRDRPERECPGLIFRCSISVYRSASGYAQKIELIPQKRLSCKIEKCPVHGRNFDRRHMVCETGWVPDYINEDLDSWDKVLPFGGVNDPVDGGYYRFKLECTQDWESGLWEVDASYFYLLKGVDGKPLTKDQLKVGLAEHGD